MEGCGIGRAGSARRIGRAGEGRACGLVVGV